MNQNYDPQKLEAEVQAYWEKQGSFTVSEDLNKEKFYCLSMLPYPSGNIHMGHARNYTIGDVIARYQRMLGKNVLQPFGWDAFGLPAENAALQHKLAPSEWTKKNIAEMRSEVKRLGLAIDWEREIATCDPSYYKWEQLLFLKMYRKGLVYRKNSIVNWDPVDQTVLANEQVIEGRGWRSGALIERKEIPQWFLKITAYSDELLDELDKLVGWPEQVRTMQKNWIGRSEGVVVHFPVKNKKDPNSSEQTSSSSQDLSVFTTRADTLFGVTYLAIAPQHELAQQAGKRSPEIAAFLNKCQHLKAAEEELATQEKEGVPTDLVAVHPLTGEELPVWIANFVLLDYGSGAVMAVPAHDQRDFEFAKKYSLPLKTVISPPDQSSKDFSSEAFVAPGILINSREFNGLATDDAKKAIAQKLEEQNQGKLQTHYRLRDWGISRQRYWGTPIPMIYCEKCGIVPVAEKDLPVILPENIFLETPSSPLKNLPEFLQTKCPQCGGDAKRETDTFDTFMESSWYYLRYCCHDQTEGMLDERVKYWMPVDLYVGGIEHAVLHLLYARFIERVICEEVLMEANSFREPFTKLLTQGMVLKDGAKMSKSKGNTVSVQEIISKYGADTARLFMIFASPPEQSLEWSDHGIEGAYRFLKKLWNFAHSSREIISKLQIKIAPSTLLEEASSEQLKIRRHIHEILSQANQDMQRLQFNTVVSAAMKLLGLLQDLKPLEQIDQFLLKEGLQILLCLLAPITPHIIHVLWKELGFAGEVLDAPWPKVSFEALKTETAEITVQINGKMRGRVKVPFAADNELVKKLVLADPNTSRFLVEKTIKKTIIIPNRLINIVI